MVQQTQQLIQSRKIDKTSYQKAAAIYESVIKEISSENGENKKKLSEEYFCEVFHEFIFCVFEFEKEISGDFYLDFFEVDDEKEEEKEDENGLEPLNSVIVEVTEEEEESTVMSKKVKGFFELFFRMDILG